MRKNGLYNYVDPTLEVKRLSPTSVGDPSVLPTLVSPYYNPQNLQAYPHMFYGGYYNDPNIDPITGKKYQVATNAYTAKYNGNVQGGSFESIAKSLAKKGVSLALDQIPKGTEYLGATLGAAVPTLLENPELAPIGAVIGKKTGKFLGEEARKYIKNKTGYGKNMKYVKVLSFPDEKKRVVQKPKPKRGGQSEWITRVKKYQRENSVSYKDALKALGRKK